MLLNNLFYLLDKETIFFNSCFWHELSYFCDLNGNMKAFTFFLGMFCLFYGFGQNDTISPAQLKDEVQIKSATVSYQNNFPKQVEVEEIEKEGEIEEIRDQRLEALLQDYNEKKVLKGYRVQLFAGKSKMQALKVKAEFLKQTQDFIPEVIYQSPNFKVRVGNFRDRLAAFRFLKSYKEQFPSAFIVQDEVDVSSLHD